MNILRIIVSVSLIVILYLQHGSTILESLNLLQTFDSMLYVLFAIILHMADKALRVFNLKLLLAKGKIVIAYLKLLHITLVSAFFGFFFPGGSGPDIARIIHLKNHTDGIASPMSATLWLNIATVQAAALLSFIGATSAIIMDLPINTTLMHTIATFSLVAFFAVLFFLHRSIQRIFRYYFENKLLKNWAFIRRVTGKLLDAFESQTGAGVFTQTILISLAVLLLTAVRTYYLSEALALDVGLIFYVIIMPIILFILIAPISFAGIGVREYSFVFFLGMVGVQESSAFALGVMVTVLNVLVSVLGGILYLFSLAGTDKKNTGRSG